MIARIFIIVSRFSAGLIHANHMYSVKLLPLLENRLFVSTIILTFYSAHK